MPTGHKNRFVLSLLTILLALSAPLRVHASAANQIDQAINASKTWVAQIDAGKYDDSYTFTCEETRAKYPQDRWVDVLKTIRTPWGSVLNRHQLSHVYEPNGVKGLEGECMTITYNTNFKNYNNVTETVVLKWEDGQWRGAGYFAGVKADPNAPPPTPSYTTEVQTQNHVTAPPQSPAQAQ
jgi:hypothetical protein